MIVLDAYAVLAFLRDEPAALEVLALLEGEDPTTLTVLGVAEVLDYLIRLAGVDEDEAMLDLAQLGLDQPVPLEASVAAQAGMLRARHYHRRDRALSLADCVALAVARASSASLVTADPHLLDACRAEGIATIALPGGDGTRWTPEGA